MKRKTYRAETMKEARLKVKMDLGEQAKILETRRVKEGGFFGFMAETIVEVDACAPTSSNGTARKKTNGGVSPKRNGKRRTQRNNGKVKSNTRKRDEARSTDEGFERSVDEPLEPNVSPRQQATNLIRERESGSSSTGETHTYNRPAPNTSESNAKTENETIDQENDKEVSTEKLTRVLENTDRLTEKIDELASALDDQDDSIETGGENYPGELSSVYRDLLNEGIEAEFARDLIARSRRQLEANEIDDRETVFETIKNEMSQDINIANPIQVDDDDPLLLPFVGPTGVGKTTTMAKLAAHFSVEEGQSVSFITFDTYRLAAVEQLRCYADILQVPVEAVMSEEEFEETLEEFRAESDIVFIDTAGRSQFDTDKISELESMIKTDESVITHLVVDATSRADDLNSVLEGFDPIGYDRVVVTKLDETKHYGTLLNLARSTEAPIGYLTNGQDVPDDLERFNSDEIADLIVEKYVQTAASEQIPEAVGV